MGDITTVKRALAMLLAGLPFCAFGQEAMEAVRKYKIPFETTEHKTYCKARVSLEYGQYDTEARYDGEITVEDCGPSGGTYVISVRYRDASGEVRSVETEHTWHREDDQDVAIDGVQSIGENVDLIRVRARKVQCVCDEVASQSPEDETKGENE